MAVMVNVRVMAHGEPASACETLMVAELQPCETLTWAATLVSVGN
jgi:hypothetical protein